MTVSGVGGGADRGSFIGSGRCSLKELVYKGRRGPYMDRRGSNIGVP